MNEHQKEAKHKRTVLKTIYETFFKPLAEEYQGIDRREDLTIFDALYEIMGRDRHIRHYVATEAIDYMSQAKIKKGWHVLVRYDATMLSKLGIDVWAGPEFGCPVDDKHEVQGRVSAQEYRDYIAPKLRELTVGKNSKS